MQVTAVLTHAEEGGFVAFNPETGTTSQGGTLDEAITNLREAVELYLEEFPMKLTGSPLITTFAVQENA
ncbi:type II toxin-antitoxin system HicB family antitoxin [Blastomonas sp. SL216]|uniref:type II toxin-antitoxin system HicB family antitoxin n=1 Tax=Blastomonas sp. SL216 TaxID=2995169 RepID=UPI0023771173|nr:type II toxin-antitoxin system HicB family antitoxin [Blastomonas sp. SL216]